jgi:hypothetical protein
MQVLGDLAPFPMCQSSLFFGNLRMKRISLSIMNYFKKNCQDTILTAGELTSTKNRTHKYGPKGHGEGHRTYTESYNRRTGHTERTEGLQGKTKGQSGRTGH